MKATTAVLTLFAATLALAAPKALTGGPGDLDKEMDARAAKIGKVGNAAAPFAALVQKKELIRIAFGDVPAVHRGAKLTEFFGRRPAPGGVEVALVDFAGDVDVSTHCSAVVIGRFTGVRDVPAADGRKVSLPVFAARVVGVIDGGTPKDGRLAFAPNSPIRVYEAASAAKKGPAKK